MTLESNAMLTVEELFDLLGITKSGVPCDYLRLYNSSADATAATVTITDTTMVLVVTGGTNAGPSTITFSDADSDTLTELIAKINGLSKGWVANLESDGAQASTDLYIMPVTGCLLVANEITVTGFDRLRLERLINGTSQAIETYCDRVFHAAAYTEYFDGVSGSCKMYLKQYPINSITQFEMWDSENNVSSYIYTVNTEYLLYDTAGYIYLRGGMTTGHKNYKIAYNGGYSTIPEDLKLACKMLCSAQWNAGKAQGITAERIGDYSINYGSSASLLAIMGNETVKQILDLYKKVSM